MARSLFASACLIGACLPNDKASERAEPHPMRTLIGTIRIGSDVGRCYLHKQAVGLTIDLDIATTWDAPGYSGEDFDAWLLAKNGVQVRLVERPDAGVLPKAGSKGATISARFRFAAANGDAPLSAGAELVAVVMSVRGRLYLVELGP